MSKGYKLEEFISTICWLAEDNCDVTFDEGTLTKLEFHHVVADALDVVGCTDCAICSVDCCEIREYYMVTNELWEQYGVVHGMLCIGCLEQRMGRELTKDDFMVGAGDNVLDCNSPEKQHSERLADRLQRTCPEAALK